MAPRYALHYWPTPNGHKVTLLLEELGLAHEIVAVDIGAGQQFEPEFLKIAPNNRMPALVDRQPADGGPPLSLFESGAILLHLANEHGAFLPADRRGRGEVLQWLFWQMAGLGPMLGQAGHFRNYAPERVDYGIRRYTGEAMRLLAVLDRRLADRAFMAGEDYSIADMASYPWAAAAQRVLKGEGLPAWPHLDRWVEAIAARPATRRAYALADEPRFAPRERTEEEKRRLFQQDASTVTGRAP